MIMKRVLFLLLSLLMVAACSKDNGDDNGGGVAIPSQIDGTIEKGPFVVGSKVTMRELDTKLNQTGTNIYTTETTDNNGSFSFANLKLNSRYVEMEISGYFFNEVTGLLSTSQITLNAVADNDGRSAINVNLLTHIEFKRIKKLVASGSSFADAKAQATRELRKAFLITAKLKNSDEISLADGDDAASMLLVFSSVLLHNKSEAQISDFVARLSNDFADNGTIESQDLLSSMIISSQEVDIKQARTNMISHYLQNGIVVEYKNIGKFIDRNGDGVIDDEDAELVENEILYPEVGYIDEAEFMAAMYGCLYAAKEYFTITTTIDAAICKQIDTKIITLKPSDLAISDAWETGFTLLNQCDKLIYVDFGDRLSFDPAKYIASAKVLKAAVYIDMIQHWGDLPKIENNRPPALSMPRVDKNVLYTMLVDNLTQAAAVLGDYEDPKTVFLSKQLANTLLAEIYLERGDPQSAIAVISEVLNSQSYGIVADQTIYSDRANRESLYSIYFSDDIPPSLDVFARLFNEKLKKGNLHPIHRISSVMLTGAQAYIKAGEIQRAQALVNKLVTTHNLGTVTLTQASANAQICSLWNSIITTDHGYYHALKRASLAMETLGLEQYQLLLPIPQKELNYNKDLKQNPEY